MEQQYNSLGRIPPQNIEAEQAVIGSCLIDKNTLPDVIGTLTPEDFYMNDHQKVFEAIKALYADHKPVDIITVSDFLKAKGVLEQIGGLEYLTNIATSVPTTANAKHYTKIVKNMSVRRQIIKSSSDIMNMAYQQYFNCDLDLKNAAMQKLDIPLTDSKNRKCDIASIFAECLADIEKQYNSKYDEKLFTGFSDYDRVTAGFHPQELTIIAARPGVGKTAFALELMVNLSKRKNHCLFISREMSTMQIGKRILSNFSGVDGQKLRFCKSLNDEDWSKIGKTAGYICDLPIEINDSLSNIQEIRAYCRELYNKNKLDVLFIDYIGLLKTLKKCDSRRAEIEDISRQCKELSLEFGIPVVVLSQLNRENERDKREPKLYDLRESGAIEQDADNVIFLHIPKDTDETSDAFDIKVIISKQRNGPTGFIYLRYFRKIFRFYSKG